MWTYRVSESLLPRLRSPNLTRKCTENPPKPGTIPDHKGMHWDPCAWKNLRLSRALAGAENDRVQVYGFASHMQALAMVAGGGVTILSHPSLSGINSGSGISGSTASKADDAFLDLLRRARLRRKRPHRGEPRAA